MNLNCLQKSKHEAQLKIHAKFTTSVLYLTSGVYFLSCLLFPDLPQLCHLKKVIQEHLIKKC
jgi:hypothetical protein